MALLISTVAHPHWFAPTQRWVRPLLPLLPRWTVVTDRAALEGYYYGQSSLYQWEIVRAWAAPVVVWTLFLLVFMGTLLCLVTLVAFATAGGMAPWFALLFFGMVFAFAAVATRIRAELGFTVHDMFVGYQHPLGLSLGSEALGARNVAWMGLLYWMTRRSTSHPMPHQLEGYRLAERAGLAFPSMTAVMVVATAIGIPTAFATFLLPERYRKSHVGHRTHYASAPRTRPMGAGLDLAGQHKDGREFPVEISLSPLQTDEGVLITSVIRDITERKRTEAERDRLLALERERSEQLKLSVREAHHRIKNNLQAISDLLYLEMNAGDGSSPADVLRGSMERIQAIATVHDLLSQDEDVRVVDARAVLERLVPMVLRSSGVPEGAVTVRAEHDDHGLQRARTGGRGLERGGFRV